MAHLWAKWLRHPCRLGDPHRCRAGEIQKWPTCGQSGYVTPAVSGIPTAAERGGNKKWPTSGQSGYVTPAVSVIPTTSERGKNQKWPNCGQSGYVPPAVSGIPTAAERRGKSEVAHLWAKWLRHPCRLGDPHRCRAGGNSEGATSGQSGYVTPAVSGIPTAAERGGKSEVPHLWAKWLRHPCRLRDCHRCRAGGGNQKWPTCGQSGYVTPAVSGIPTAAERGGKSEVAHLWAKWLRHPCRLRDRHRCKAGGEIRSGPLMGKVATSPLPSRGSLPLQSGGGNQKWPTCGQSGYVTPAVSGDPHRCRAGGEIRSAPLMGKVATSPLPSR